MPEYRVFGGRLSSELTFPELHPADAGPADWHLSLGRATRTTPALVELAAEQIGDDAHVRLLQHPAGRTLAFDDTGRFDVGPGGRELCWHAAAQADVALARVDLLGRVFALALHEAGRLVLHGSAVSVDGKAIGFLAGKGSGKSTLAYALVRAGARLVTDDTLSVDPASRAVVPGVQAVRLWADSAGVVTAGARAARGAGGKLEFRELDDAELEQDAVPLDALYLLRRVEGGPAVPTRERLLGPPAALALVPQAKLGALVRGPLAQETLARAAAVAAAVPVYTLAFPSGFGALPQAAAVVRDWHRT